MPQSDPPQELIRIFDAPFGRTQSPLASAACAKVDDAGTFKFTWVDDDGSVYSTEKKLKVE